MNIKQFRNAHDRLIGRIIEGPGGIEQGRDFRDRPVGYYNPRTDETRDVANRRVGKGNFLPALITQAL